VLQYLCMLQAENRLLKVRDFNLLLKHGAWLNSDNFSLRILDLGKNQNIVPAKEDKGLFVKQLRIGFAVGLKISKSAVKRNRLKRQAREIVRLLIKDKKIKAGVYLLFVAKAGSLNLEHKQIESQVLELLKRARCLM